MPERSGRGGRRLPKPPGGRASLTIVDDGIRSGAGRPKERRPDGDPDTRLVRLEEDAADLVLKLAAAFAVLDAALAPESAFHPASVPEVDPGAHVHALESWIRSAQAAGRNTAENTLVSLTVD